MKGTFCTNLTVVNQNRTVTPNDTLAATLEPYVYIIFSGVNSVTSAFSAFLFIFWGREVHLVLRRLLILLSIFEASFHLSVIFVYILNIALPQDYLKLAPIWITAFHCHLRVSLTMRNWTVAVISWSRVEAVACPLSSKRGTLFRGVRIAAILCILGAIGIFLSCCMQIALERPEIFTGSKCTSSNATVIIVEYVFYTFQGVLPVLLVIIAMIITIYCLYKQAVIRQELSGMSPNSNNNTSNENSKFIRGNASSLRRELQAVRIIIALSITFSVLEIPTDFYGFVRLKTPEVELAVNFLVELDSLGNFIIYTCATKLFKNFWKATFRKKQNLYNTVTTPTSVAMRSCDHSSPKRVELLDSRVTTL